LAKLQDYNGTESSKISCFLWQFISAVYGSVNRKRLIVEKSGGKPKTQAETFVDEGILELNGYMGRQQEKESAIGNLIIL
jgi:hypothetical protein